MLLSLKWKNFGKHCLKIHLNWLILNIMWVLKNYGHLFSIMVFISEVIRILRKNFICNRCLLFYIWFFYFLKYVYLFYLWFFYFWNRCLLFYWFFKYVSFNWFMSCFYFLFTSNLYLWNYSFTTFTEFFRIRPK